MRAVALLFFFKAAALAFFVTPLWDIPDEVGHFAIIADLADGRGLPLPGRSVLPADVLSDWTRDKAPAAPVYNWVAQHPPLYHLLAVPFLAAARAITDDPRWRFRTPRLLSAISGAAALLLFFQVFCEAGKGPLAAFVAAAAIGTIPMYTHLSSGTNHDVLVAFFAGVTALFWVRLVGSGLFSDGVKMGVALALMSAVKLSALVVTAALLALSWRALAARGPRRVFQWATIAALSASLPALWTLRHWRLVGNVRVHPISRKAFDLGGLVAYLRGYPVVDHTFKNFFGLIGWTGTGGGNLRWLQISGAFLAPYLVVGLLAAIGAAVWFATRPAAKGRGLAAAAAAILFAGSFFWLFSDQDGSALLKRLLYSLLASVPFLALPRLSGRDAAGRIFAGSQLVFLVFAAAYLANSWEAFEIYGEMRATNGRYFFAVLPFLALASFFPALRLTRRSARRDFGLLLLLAALFVNEAAFFLLRVIPFYRSAPVT